MNNSKSTIRDKAIKWWESLPEFTQDELSTKYFFDGIESIYLQENPSPVNDKKEKSQDNSKERFTSGEWVAMNKTGTGIYKIVSDTLQEICETQMPYGDDLNRPEVFKQGEANARLIAQAPDMYRLLLDARKLLQLTEIIHKSVECGKVAKNITSLLNRIDNK